MAVEIFVHKMTEHMESARIIKWRVAEGEAVKQFQVILEVETEKATVELESPASGIIKGIRKGVESGIEVPVGMPLAYIAAADEQVPDLPPLGDPYLSEKTVVMNSNLTGANRSVGTNDDLDGIIRATPIARKLARDLKINLEDVQGSGPRGRIREDDVRTYMALRESAKGMREPVHIRERSEQAGEWLDLTSIQRLTGERMLESVRTAPQFALEVSADLTELLHFRDNVVAEKQKISITAFLVKAVAFVIRNHPRANSVFTEGRMHLLDQINIGVAVGSENGLVVPVIHRADQKPVSGIQQELLVFQEKAAQMRFRPDDLEGGSFTITNLGMYGIERFTAILNPPQSAILAVGKVLQMPVGLSDGKISVKPVLNLTLTIDHRVMDGVHGARFLADLKSSLETLSFLV